MKTIYIAQILLEFTSDDVKYLRGIKADFDQRYGLFVALGATVLPEEIISLGGSVQAGSGVWLEEFQYTLYLELHSGSLTDLHHQIAIVFHWAELVSANASVLQILMKDDTSS